MKLLHRWEIHFTYRAVDKTAVELVAGAVVPFVVAPVVAELADHTVSSTGRSRLPRQQHYLRLVCRLLEK